MSHPYLSIVIPAYNESARIELTLERVMECVYNQEWDAEVLVIDDGSTDDTREIVKRWMQVHARLHLIQNPGNRGKGYSVRNGLLQAAGDVVMFTDADLSAPMEEAERLLAVIEAGADVAIGSRWMDADARPFISRSTAASSADVSTASPAPSWASRSRTRSAASRPSAVPPHRSSSACNASSAGALILKSSSSPANSLQDPRSPRHLGPRRAQPHLLSQRRHEDARRIAYIRYNSIFGRYDEEIAALKDTSAMVTAPVERLPHIPDATEARH
jgi:hypothetical protein